MFGFLKRIGGNKASRSGIVPPESLVTPQQVMEAVAKIGGIYTTSDCPCRFPRFRELVSFDFRTLGISPIGCLEVEALINSLVRIKNGCYERQGEPSNGSGETVTRYTCKKCGACAVESYDDYNIHMSRSVLKFDSLPLVDIGADVHKPIPVMKGFYGFIKPQDAEVLRRNYFIVSAEAFIAYMVERC